MRYTILDVENTVTRKGGKLHLDPFEVQNQLVMVGIMRDDMHDLYTFNHSQARSDLSYMTHQHTQVQTWLDNTDVLVMHNASHDLLWLWECGFKYDGEIHDTMLCEYLLQRGQKGSVSLENCALRRELSVKKEHTMKEYLNEGVSVRDIPLKELKEYLLADLKVTQELYLQQCMDLVEEENSSLSLVNDITNSTCLVLSEIYRNGFTVDTEHLNQVENELRKEKIEIEDELKRLLYKYMGETQINLNSPEQLSWVIYSRKPKDKSVWNSLFSPYMKPADFKSTVRINSNVIYKTHSEMCKTCKGNGHYYKVKKDGTKYKKSTTCPDCKGRGIIYKETNEIAGLKLNAPNVKWHSANGFSTSKTNIEILERNTTGDVKIFLSKMKRLSSLETYINSFIEGIKTFLKEDGMLHVRLAQHMTATGRFSSREPNMQNMPRGNTFPIKKVFTSRFDGGKILEADFAQLEFRVAAFLSQDEVAMKEIREGFDVHSYTAKIISEAGQSISRQEAKAHTFAPLFGASGYGRSKPEAAYYEQFTDKYKGIGEWHNRLATEALTYRKITTPSGRQFSFPNVQRNKFGRVSYLTNIKNYPVQSLATADIVPLVLIYIHNNLNKYKSCVVNSVHDSIVVDVHPNEVDQVVGVINNIDIVKLIKEKLDMVFNVPLELDLKIGDNWLDTVDI
tara:strand:+ start:4731 stop:6764 length:2034 start_codon:yes stop_codon:yes gene_type:complete